MDQDRDGTVSLDDLKEVYASLGNKNRNKIFFLLIYFVFNFR
jgi:Ca2+-binding EF-hand superfamily protein